MTFPNVDPTCQTMWGGGAAGVEVPARWRISYAWTEKRSPQSEGTRPHLSAHRAVDGDDDKALDGVKDSEQDLREKRRHAPTEPGGYYGCMAHKGCGFESQGDNKYSGQFGGSVYCWIATAARGCVKHRSQFF